jgi:hypothetical protein
MECPYLKDTGPRRKKKSGFEKQYWNNLNRTAKRIKTTTSHRSELKCMIEIQRRKKQKKNISHF